jgi:hypothetical protein
LLLASDIEPMVSPAAGLFSLVVGGLLAYRAPGCLRRIIADRSEPYRAKEADSK